MVDPDLPRKLYEIARDAFSFVGDLPSWDELPDEKKAVWEEHAHDHEREVSNGADD